MKLDVPTFEQLEQVRQWRNEERQFLRTPYFITEEMQAQFYHDVVSNRDSKHQYFALVLPHDPPNKDGIYYDQPKFAGLGGLTNIEWENSRAEISLIINPGYRGKGYGKEAVQLLLQEGFGNMGLSTIWGEAYHCGNFLFWEKLIDKWGGHRVDIPWTTKKWNGEEYGSLMFAFCPEALKWFV